MTEPPPDPDVGEDAEGRHHALVSLHALTGRFGDLDPGLLPGYRPSSPGTALRVVAEAPEEEIPVSARLDVLYDLARAGFPHYEAYEHEYGLLASSVADRRRLDADQLLTDLKQAASGEVPFTETASGQGMRHHETAFLGEDVCTVRRVEVGGLRATWIYSELETDAPFERVAGWVDPRNWPARGPMLFKGMTLVGANAPVDIVPGGDEHWHGVFHEEVELVQRLNTLLHCDYRRDGSTFAGMTYDLDLSLDGQIDVDRGFLSVNDVGPFRRVKALKIVGFTTDVWDVVAQLVCPFWTDWVRGAVQGGKSSTPTTPADTPGPTTPSRETLDAWVQFFGDSARTYLDLFEDVTSRMSSGGYSTADWVADGTAYWSRLAKDWAQAWSHGVDTVDEVAREGLDAGVTPPNVSRDLGRGAASAFTRRGAARAGGAGAAGAAAGARAGGSARVPRRADAEAYTVTVDAFDPAAPPVCSDLVSIEARGPTIPARDVAVTVRPLEGGRAGVLLRATDPSVPAGLYVGRLEGPGGNALAPVQVYVSRASEA